MGSLLVGMKFRSKGWKVREYDSGAVAATKGKITIRYWGSRCGWGNGNGYVHWSGWRRTKGSRKQSRLRLLEQHEVMAWVRSVMNESDSPDAD